MRADGRTDMTKLIVDLRNFANVPNKYRTNQFIPFSHIFQPPKSPFQGQQSVSVANNEVITKQAHLSVRLLQAIFKIFLTCLNCFPDGGGPLSTVL